MGILSKSHFQNFFFSSLENTLIKMINIPSALSAWYQPSPHTHDPNHPPEHTAPFSVGGKIFLITKFCVWAVSSFAELWMLLWQQVSSRLWRPAGLQLWRSIPLCCTYGSQIQGLIMVAVEYGMVPWNAATYFMGNFLLALSLQTMCHMESWQKGEDRCLETLQLLR